MVAHSSFSQRLQRSKQGRVLAFLAGGLMAGLVTMPVCATPAEVAPKGQFTAAFESWQFLYREYDANGRRLNQEKGHLPGVKLAWRTSSRWDAGWEFAYQVVDETVDYAGRTNLGNPLFTVTKERIHSFATRWQYPVEQLPASWPTVSWIIEGSWHEWRRQIQPLGRISGLDERYRWHQAGTGLAVGLWESGATTLRWEALLTRTIQPELTVDFTARREGFPKLKMKDRNGGIVKLTGTYAFTSNVHALASVAWHEWAFGESPIREVGGSLAPPRIREPESETQVLVANLGVQVAF